MATDEELNAAKKVAAGTRVPLSDFLGKAPPNKASAEILAVRGPTHGSFTSNGEVAQGIKDVMRDATGWVALSPRQKEALDLIATKLARIISGDATFADHWDDIGGYAALGKTKEDRRA